MSEENKDLENNEDQDQNNENDWGDDDNFGLPDIDFQPIDRNAEAEVEPEAEEASEPEEESQEESEEETVEEEVHAQAWKQDDDFGFQNQQEEKEDDSSPDDYDLTYEDDLTSQYDKEPKKSSSGVIWTIVVIILLIGSALGYMFWYKPMQDDKAFTAYLVEGDSLLAAGNFQGAIEAFQSAVDIKPDEAGATEKLSSAQQAKAADDKKKADAAAAAKAAQEEADRLAREAAEAAKNPPVGSIDKISSRTGRYFVVVASNIDDDLAMDFANKLSKEGVSTKIITPSEQGAYHRVTIADFDTASEAQQQANSVKATYPNAWIVKF